MKLLKLSLAAALAVTLAHAEESSDLEVSANVAAVSNYVWRGMTQTNDSPAIQGGFDLGYKGFYAGVWGSNVDFGATSTTSLEADVYVGYSAEMGAFSYDIGAIEYMYPNQADGLNFGEAYLGLGYDFGVVSVGAKYSVGIDTHNVGVAADEWKPTDEWEVSVSAPLPADVTFDATYGAYDTLGSFYSAGLSRSYGKFSLSVAYTGFQADAANSDQNNFVASISTDF